MPRSWSLENAKETGNWNVDVGDSDSISPCFSIKLFDQKDSTSLKRSSYEFLPFCDSPLQGPSVKWGGMGGTQSGILVIYLEAFHDVDDT